MGIITNFNQVFRTVENACLHPMELDYYPIADEYVDRIFYVNIGNDGQDIGAEPTKMYETEDMRTQLGMDNRGITTKDYYQDLEDRYGSIFDLNDQEVTVIETEFADKATNDSYIPKNVI